MIDELFFYLFKNKFYMLRFILFIGILFLGVNLKYKKVTCLKAQISKDAHLSSREYWVNLNKTFLLEKPKHLLSKIVNQLFFTEDILFYLGPVSLNNKLHPKSRWV